MSKQRHEIEEKYQWDLTTIFPWAQFIDRPRAWGAAASGLQWPVCIAALPAPQSAPAAPPRPLGGR